MTALVSIGLPGVTAHETLRALAPRIERLGFHALWLNDSADGDSLDGLRIAAAHTTTLALGAGVIPLDRRPRTASTSPAFRWTGSRSASAPAARTAASPAYSTRSMNCPSTRTPGSWSARSVRGCVAWRPSRPTACS